MAGVPTAGAAIWVLSGQSLTWTVTQQGLTWMPAWQMSRSDISVAGVFPDLQCSWSISPGLQYGTCFSPGCQSGGHLTRRPTQQVPLTQTDASTDMCFLSGVSPAGTSPGLQPAPQECRLAVMCQRFSGASQTNAEGLGVYTSRFEWTTYCLVPIERSPDGKWSPATRNAAGSGSLPGLCFARVRAEWLTLQGQQRLGWLWGDTPSSHHCPPALGLRSGFHLPSLGKCQTPRGSRNLDNYGHYYYFLSLNRGQITHLNTTRAGHGGKGHPWGEGPGGA